MRFWQKALGVNLEWVNLSLFGQSQLTKISCLCRRENADFGIFVQSFAVSFQGYFCVTKKLNEVLDKTTKGYDAYAFCWADFLQFVCSVQIKVNLTRNFI